MNYEMEPTREQRMAIAISLEEKIGEFFARPHGLTTQEVAEIAGLAVARFAVATYRRLEEEEE